jgi:hypothetical protein
MKKNMKKSALLLVMTITLSLTCSQKESLGQCHNEFIKRVFKKLLITQFDDRDGKRTYSRIEQICLQMPTIWWRKTFDYLESTWCVEHTIFTPFVINCLIRVDDNMIAVGGRDGDIYLYDVRKGMRQSPKMLRGHTSGVQKLALRPDGKVLSVSKDRLIKIKLWDCFQGICLKTTQSSKQQYVAFGEDMRGCPSSVTSLLPLQNGSCVLGLNQSTQAGVTYWDPLAGKYLGKQGNISSVTALAESPCGSLIGGSSNGKIEFWTRDESVYSCFSSVLDKITALYACPNGMLAVGYANGNIRLQGGEMGQNLSRPILKDHRTDVTVLAMLPDGMTLLSCDADSKIKLWDIATCLCKETLNMHSQELLKDCAVLSHEQFVAAHVNKLIVWGKRYHLRA